MATTKSTKKTTAKKAKVKEVKDELHSGMKNFVHENFNETLYKDL